MRNILKSLLTRSNQTSLNNSDVPEKKTSDTAFVFIQVIGLLCGSFTGSSVRHSDWSRYAATPRSHLLGIWVAGPLAVSSVAIFGVLVTSATSEMYGEIIWQPITLLLHIQETDYSSGARAATFFAGLGWFMSQLSVCSLVSWRSPRELLTLKS